MIRFVASGVRGVLPPLPQVFSKTKPVSPAGIGAAYGQGVSVEIGAAAPPRFLTSQIVTSR